MTAPDDLTARCTALVERVQRETEHDAKCASREKKVHIAGAPRGHNSYMSGGLWCSCDRDQRVAATLGHMMAEREELVEEMLELGPFGPTVMEYNWRKKALAALRALRAAEEARDPHVR